MSSYGKRHAWMGALSRFCSGRPYAVCAIASLMCLGFAPFGSQLIGEAKVGSDPPGTWKGSKAAAQVLKYFARDTESAFFLLVIAVKEENTDKYANTSLLSTRRAQLGCGYGAVECTHRSWQNGVWPPLLQGVRSAMISTTNTVHYEHRLRRSESETAPILEVPGLTEFSFAVNESLDRHRHLIGYTSNATLWARGIATRALLNEAGTAMQITWSIKSGVFDDASQDFADEAHDVIDRLVKKYLPEDDLDWGLFSGTLVLMSALDDVEKACLLMDLTSLPLAAMVLCYVLKSFRLVLVPLMNIAIAMPISFGAMYIVAKTTDDILTTTPSMMISLTIAMTIDYCLFILTRFRQELVKSTKHDVEERLSDSMATAIETGGWAVLVSGSTLTIAFFVFACFPMPGWQTYGAAGAISTAVLVIVHLTVVPAFVHLMPEFFARCAPAPGEQDDSEQTSTSREAGAPQQEDWVRRIWGRIAHLSSDPRRGALVILVVTTITVIVGYRFPDMTLSSESDLYIPRNTDVWEAQQLTAKNFGLGAIRPLQVLMVVDSDKYDSFIEQEPWEDSQKLLQSIVDRMPHTKGIGVSSLTYSYQHGKSQLTPWSQVTSCRQVFNLLNSTCIALLASSAQFISADQQAQIATISLGIDPLGAPGREFIRRTRDLLEEFGKKTSLRFQLAGFPAQTVDAFDQLTDTFPYVVVTTFAVSLTLLAIAFQTVVYPITCILTIILTLVFTYGLAVRIYQDSLLDWTGIEAFENRFDVFPVGSPFGSFSIVVGLCLDYDIFLISSITELRVEGMPAKEAIIEGLCRSGGIITAAGTIMAIAFGGLMFCTTVYTVNLTGYFFAISVLYDTFVIRSFVVPSAMIILGRFNWWPSDLAYDDKID